MASSQTSDKQTKSYLMIAISVVVVMLIVIGGLVFVDRINKIEHEWEFYSNNIARESVALSDLYRHMGYGGVIHSFKNYVLRGDDQALQEAYHSHQYVVDHFDEYRAVFYEPELEEEFNIIMGVLGQYMSNIEVVREMRKEGARPEEIDAAVKIDDAPAIRSLEVLALHMKRHANNQIELVRIKAGDTIDLILLVLAVLVVSIVLMIVMVVAINRQYLKSKTIAEENKDALDNILNRLSDTVIAVDQGASLVWVNSAATKMFGYEKEELIGANINRLLPDKVRFRHEGLFNHYFESPTPRELSIDSTLHAIRKDGEEFPVEIALNTVSMNGEHVVIAAVHDITDRVLYEKKIETLNQSLIRNNRELNEINKELESFSYSVSHDLRGPLRAIGGFSSLLSEKLKDTLDEDAQDYLARIRGSSKRMGELIDSLLKLSRYVRAGVEIESCNLSEISTMVYNRINDAADEPYDASIEIQDDLYAMADNNLMDVVLYNLLSNALKFTCHTENAEIKVGMFVPKGGQATFFVSDNGDGFDMAYAERLFLPFHQLHTAGKYEGCGIGLATVQRIIRRHGGRIWADSSPGSGTTFYFTLSNPHEKELDRHE